MTQKYISRCHYSLLVSVSSRQMAPRKSDIIINKLSCGCDNNVRGCLYCSKIVPYSRLVGYATFIGHQFPKLITMSSLIEIRCTDEPCQNLGVCTNDSVGFLCDCPYNYTGPVCDQGILQAV